MVNQDMSVRTARRIRRKLIALMTGAGVYPRRSTHSDSVALGLFARMVELHESICVLAQRGKRRDAVILGRTICEVAIWLYWLTNKDVHERFERYFTFGGKVIDQFFRRFNKYLGREPAPVSKRLKDLVKNADVLFAERASQWNEKSIWEMANETDQHERTAAGAEVNLAPQNGIFYFWLSLHSHPTVWGIQAFLPMPGQPFTSSQPQREWNDTPELKIVSLSTIWLSFISSRIGTALKLRDDGEFRKIILDIKSERGPETR